MLVREDAQTIKTRQPCGEIENNVEILKDSDYYIQYASD
jgi:hypothetical protein